MKRMRKIAKPKEGSISLMSQTVCWSRSRSRCLNWTRSWWFWSWSWSMGESRSN
jgi:hypothetical protein